MENKSQQYKGYGIIEDAHASYTSSKLSIFLKVDSKERIFDFKFLSDDKGVCSFLSSQRDRILDLEITDPTNFFSIEFGSELNKLDYDLVSSHFILCFHQYLGFAKDLSSQGVDDTDILCHCSSSSYAYVKDTFKKSRGDKLKTIQETMCSSYCGSCHKDVESYLDELEGLSQFFLGEKKEVWEIKLNTLLEDFFLFCPPEFSDLKFELIGLKYDLIRIRCHKGSSSLGRKEIQDTLSNYLLSEIEETVKISVIT